MTVQTCVRCGQLLLPEIVRELGDGRRCPFCNADLKVDAKAATKEPPRSPAARLQPARAHRARGARAGPSAESAPAARQAPTARRADRARGAVAGCAHSPRRVRSAHADRGRRRGRARAAHSGTRHGADPGARPRPDARARHRPQPAAVPAPLLALAPSSPPWLAALRRRPWLAAPAVLAVIVTIGLVVGRRPSATLRESSAPGPSVVPLSAERRPPGSRRTRATGSRRRIARTTNEGRRPADRQLTRGERTRQGRRARARRAPDSPSEEARRASEPQQAHARGRPRERGCSEGRGG